MKRNQHYEALEVMCQRCFNHEMCMGTGCRPKIMLQEMVNHATHLEKALDKACRYLEYAIEDTVYSRYEGNELVVHKKRHATEEEWKGWLLEDD